MRIVIDASMTAAGRVASYAAKQALFGAEVIIVNSEKAIITGKPNSIVQRYVDMRDTGGSSQKGPKISARPEFLLKRTIRGMLSHKMGRGRTAFRKIRCYIGVPKEYSTIEQVRLTQDYQGRFITLGNLAQMLKHSPNKL